MMRTKQWTQQSTQQSTRTTLTLGIAGAAVVLAACGGDSGPLDERGVWKYGVTAADTRPSTTSSSRGGPRYEPSPTSAEPTAPTAAPVAPPPTAPTASTPTPTPVSEPTRTPEPPRETMSSGAYKVVAVKGGGSIRVSCRLKEPKELPKLLMFKDEENCGHHKGYEMPSERLVYDAKTLGCGYCFVSIRGITAGKDWPPEMPAVDPQFTLDQKGCSYFPHLAGIRPGTQIVVLNSDAADHNIHGYRDLSNTGQLSDTKFNFGSSPGSTKDPEVALLSDVGTYIVKCDIHPWMSGHVVVMPHPYFDVTPAMDDGKRGRKAGEALIEDVPPGDYDIDMWHEGVVETVKTINGVPNAVAYSPPFFEHTRVTVKTGEQAKAEIVFSAR